MFRGMNAFLTDLASRWRDAARRRGIAIEAPELDPPVVDELLQLARVVAHSKERSFAPLAAFMAGIAVERSRGAGTDPASVAAYIREVREELEGERPPG